MIVCKKCGNHNQEGDQFCGSCGSFLEWTGEKVEEAEPEVIPEPEPEPAPKKQTVIEKVKTAVGIDETQREAERQTQEEAERQAQEETERQAQEETENKAKAEAESLAREEAEKEAREEAEARAKAEAEAKEREEQERQAKEEAEQRAKKEAAAKAKAEAERKKREEAEKRAREQAELKAREQQGVQSQEEAERSAREQAEAEETARKEAAAAARAEEERKAREEEEAKAEQEAEAKAKAELQARKKAEEEKKARQEAEKRAKEEAEAKAAASKEAAAAEDRKKRAEALLSKAKPVVAAKTEAPPIARTSPPAAQAAASQVRSAPTEKIAEVPRRIGAVTPEEPVRRPPPVIKEKTAPTRKIEPGDLICGQCGEVNDAGRNFCRRCGNTLAEAQVAKVPWFKKLFARKKKPVEAGERPGRGRGQMGRGAAQAKLFSLSSKLGRVLALLAIVGIGLSLAVPSFRSVVFGQAGGLFQKVRQAVAPKYEPVRPTSAEATSSLPDRPPAAAIDGIKNSYWAEGAPGDGTGQTLILVFDPPADIARIGITPGASAKPEEFVAQPRPKELHLVFSDGSTKDIQLEDKAEFQNFDVDAKQATRVEIHIVSVFGSLQGDACAIAEVEFFTKT